MHGFVEFIFPRRLHRLAYFLRAAALNIVTGFLCANSTTLGPGYWWPLVIALTLYSLFFIVLPRIRDAGMSGWWLVVAFIPVADIVLGILLLFRAPAVLRHPSPGKDTSPSGDAGVGLGGSAITERPPSVS